MSTQPTPHPTGDPPTLIANLWHTLFIVVAVSGYAYRATLDAAHGRAALAPSRPHLYLRTMLFEWVFLAIVVFGVRLHGAPLQTIFGRRWRSLLEVLRDFGLGISLMLVSDILVAIVRFLDRDDFSLQSIQFLIPQSTFEVFLWIALSLTAGICEEVIFRGYLQRQFAAITRSVPIGILLSGIAFGAAHLYQGWRRAAAIVVMGIAYGVVAEWRGTVRPGMFAHVVQDSIAALLFKLIPH